MPSGKKLQVVAEKFVVSLHCPDVSLAPFGVQRLPCFSKQLASLSQWLAIWVMSWMKRFSKSFKGPFQILPNGRPGVLGCAAFGEGRQPACHITQKNGPMTIPTWHLLFGTPLHPHIQIWEWSGVANAFPSAWDDLLVCHPWLFALLSRTFPSHLFQGGQFLWRTQDNVPQDVQTEGGGGTLMQAQPFPRKSWDQCISL